MTFPNRTACDVLEELRMCDKTRNFAPCRGLVEELQSICNRMEAGLGDKHDVEEYRIKRSKLRREVGALRRQKEELEEALTNQADFDSAID